VLPPVGVTASSEQEIKIIAMDRMNDRDYNNVFI